MASNQEESGYLLEKEGQPEKSGQLAKPKLKFSDACAQSEGKAKHGKPNSNIIMILRSCWNTKLKVFVYLFVTVGIICVLIYSTPSAFTCAAIQSQLGKDAQDENAKLRDENAKLLDKNAKLQDENEKLRDENAKLQDENVKLWDENEKLLDENEKLRDENEKLQDAYAKLQAEVMVYILIFLAVILFLKYGYPAAQKALMPAKKEHQVVHVHNVVLIYNCVRYRARVLVRAFQNN